MPKPRDGAAPAPGRGFDPSFKDNTPLQRHVAFFDADNDGVIWPSDTYRGFRDLGFNMIMSSLAMIIVHVSLSWFMFDTLWPDPCFRLKIKYAHRAKHGSDSEVFTSVGEFDENRFNELFDMYSSAPHTHMTFKQGVRMLYGNRNPYDFFGWTAAAFEWLATYLLLGTNGKVKREDVQDIFDGSIFYKKSKSGRRCPN